MLISLKYSNKEHSVDDTAPIFCRLSPARKEIVSGHFAFFAPIKHIVHSDIEGLKENKNLYVNYYANCL